MKKFLSLIALTFLLLSSFTMAGSSHHHHQPTCPEGSYLANYDDPLAFANSVVSTSGTIINPNAALGDNDGSYARIYPTHPDSYLVLDMGEGEEVWDRFGLDFKVYNDNSREYWAKVYVSNDPSSGWEYVGKSDGRGSDEFTIAFTSYDSFRYVGIVNTDSRRQLEIDAVRGFCISNPHEEEVPEFGLIGALVSLGLAGLFIYKKRSN